MCCWGEHNRTKSQKWSAINDVLFYKNTHKKKTLVPALLTWQRSWFFQICFQTTKHQCACLCGTVGIRLKYKPIIYIINNSLAFRYVTSQIWKYYGILGFVQNKRGRIHEHKAPFRVCKPLKYTPLSVYVRDAFRISTLSGGFVFKCATHGIRSSSAGGYQTALHYCRRQLLAWGWIACIRCKASCTEPRYPYRDGSVRIHVSFHP